MDARYRAIYNANYSDERYRRYAADLERRLGTAIPFRLAETPVFLPVDFVERAQRAGREILTQLSDPKRIAAMERAVPERWNVPNRTALPSIAILDFAAVREGDDAIVPRLIELQGFPSLLGFSLVQAHAWSDALQEVGGLDGAWSSSFGLSDANYIELARRTIAGSCDPRTTVLVDLAPLEQKTFPDFAATKHLWNIDAVDLRALRRRGKRLFRIDANGDELPVERMYYRVVIDEIERAGESFPFDVRDELDVQWSPHPNWFWIWSKVSLPSLEHPAVPRTTLISDLDAIPDDLEHFVLKPLFSFAGGGVNVSPVRADIEAIPQGMRDDWCLQEKVTYADVIPAADGGGVKLEVRLMFLRPDDAPGFTLAQNLCRLSRGAMIGVDYNRDRTWVGSSVGLLRA